MIKKIHNVTTGEIIERDLTQDEIEQNKKDEENANRLNLQLEAQKAAKNAVLNKLGLTAEEIAILVQ
jgi:dihydroxyacid dehydratase/phosphogluconate dehydratase